MRYFTRLICAALFFAAPAAHAACALGEFTEQNTYALPGCPAEVKDVVARMYGCDHWAGEEPYDKARREEIAAAVKKLRCDTYPADYRAMLEKYQDDKNVSRALNEAIATDEIDF